MILYRLNPLLNHFLNPRSSVGLGQALILKAWDGYAALRTIRHPTDVKSPAGAIRLHTQTKPFMANSSFFHDHIISGLIPFWQEHAADHECGGFITHLDRQGAPYDLSVKTAAMQARMVYGFSVAYHLSGKQEHLKLAQHGLRFLIDHFWDKDRGGWFLQLDRQGQVISADKDSFSQAYVLLGLAECHRLTGDPEALDYAKQTYALLDLHLWDPRHQGYFEACCPDWQPKSRDKTICIQLDMLIAIMSLYQISHEESHLARARQLSELICSKMLHGRYGGLGERFSCDWVYQPLPSRDQLWIGHCLKGAWLLLEMGLLTGRDDFVPQAQRLVDFCLRYGWDTVHGGFYQFVFRRGQLASSQKIWWTQCEGLQALLLLHVIGQEQTYLDYFQELAKFSFAHFYDCEFGEWVTVCHPDGAVKDTNKGGSWKAAYHTVQMCFTVGALLSKMEK